jgi:hypothetical protein
MSILLFMYGTHQKNWKAGRAILFISIHFQACHQERAKLWGLRSSEALGMNAGE